MAVPNDGELAAIASDQVEVRRKAVGMVLGTAGPGGREIIARGDVEAGGSRRMTADTVFEIASVSKVFPSIVLADMVGRGEVALTDPVDRHLPRHVQVPRRHGRAITLVDLATHTSGLPPQPDDFPTLDHPGAAGFSRDQLYRAVSACRLTRDIGSEWEYGNVDTALLAYALAHRAGREFDVLVEERITGPLGLSSTAFVPSSSMAPRVASSHDSDHRPMPRLALGALAPAGSMLSTADDLLTLAAALLELIPSTLAGVLPVMLRTRRPIMPSLGRMLRQNWRMILRMAINAAGAPPPRRYFSKAEAALGWFVLSRGNEELVVHDGAGPGGAASLALDPHARTAAVVLSNTGQTVQDVSRHLLRRDFPLADTNREVKIDPAVLDRYVGTYRPRDGVLFDIRRDADRLTIGLPVIGRLPLRGRTEHDFFVPELGYEFRFARELPIRELLFRAHVALPMVPLQKIFPTKG